MFNGLKFEKEGKEFSFPVLKHTIRFNCDRDGCPAVVFDTRKYMGVNSLGLAIKVLRSVSEALESHGSLTAYYEAHTKPKDNKPQIISIDGVEYVRKDA